MRDTVLDTDGMWAATNDLPDQIEHGAAVASSVGDLPDGPVSAVVCLGMGGSGIGADILQAIAGPECPVPIVVVKDYELPAFVDSSSLVIASSFSGNTEETLGAAAASVQRGASLVAVTTGGALGALASSAGAPVVPVPSSIPHPRAAIGAMTVGPLVVLSRMGLLPDTSASVAATVAQLRHRRETVAELAEGVAKRIGRTIPLIYGGGLLGRAAAIRWKCQVNENPKSPAFWAAQPELCHNELTGWGQGGDVTRQLITLVDLRHGFEHPQVGRRFELVDEIMDEVVAGVVTVEAAGEGPLAQVFDLVFIGDYVALCLAAQEGLDPGPIPVLESLKQALA